jgi:DNA topoisomerase IA
MKLCSEKLRMSASMSMMIMERLYNRGFLSYPRTETTVYHSSIDLKTVILKL